MYQMGCLSDISIPHFEHHLHLVRAVEVASDDDGLLLPQPPHKGRKVGVPPLRSVRQPPQPIACGTGSQAEHRSNRNENLSAGRPQSRRASAAFCTSAAVRRRLTTISGFGRHLHRGTQMEGGDHAATNSIRSLLMIMF